MKRRPALEATEAAWLEGDRDNAGFVPFLHDETLIALWEAYGDHVNMHWHPGMYAPEPK
ncbi:hypothetical protein [Bradyrhizobium sp. USDA 372]